VIVDGSAWWLAHLPALALAARAVAEQGEAHAVQDAGLARTRRSVNQEESLGAQLGEVDHLPVRERPEGLHL
jgi:hypothetical protein